MKTKALIGIAVASTFGWATSTYAGSSHEVVTPLSVSDAGEVLPMTSSSRFVSSEPTSWVGSTSGAAASSNGSFSESTASSSTLEESIAMADQGIYSDVYFVSAPVMVESWDYYVIDTTLPASEQVAIPVDMYLIPAYDVVVF